MQINCLYDIGPKLLKNLPNQFILHEKTYFKIITSIIPLILNVGQVDYLCRTIYGRVLKFRL